MSKLAPRSPSVIIKLADVLRQDFDAQFKPLFVHTTKVRQARPYEAVYEGLNALEHLANATRLEAELDQKATASSTRNQLAEQIDVQLWQARRHLTIGRFFCIEHQITALMYRLVDFASGVGSGHGQSRAKQQARATALEQKLKNATDIKVVRLNSIDDLIKDTHKFDKRVEDLTELLNEFQRLASDVAGAAGKKSKK